MLNVCVPVVKRYDLLRELLYSLEKSTIIPDFVRIIDNGKDGARLKLATESVDLRIDVYTPNTPLGVAESWNWFIHNVPEERVIANDDVVFAPTSLAKMVHTPGDLVWAANEEGGSEGFSCYLIRDSCIEKIGEFDENISPGYGYYEDDDYLQRLDGRGTREPSAIATVCQAGIKHYRSSTLRSATHHEILEHHRKFKIAQDNYMKKWGLTAI